VVDEVGEDCCWGLVEVPVLIVRVRGTLGEALGEAFVQGPSKASDPSQERIRTRRSRRVKKLLGWPFCRKWEQVEVIKFEVDWINVPVGYTDDCNVELFHSFGLWPRGIRRKTQIETRASRGIGLFDGTAFGSRAS
jgi:hypothetical protein